jgi:glycosyltransferase involved in cell wall biosynthesis
MHNMSIGVVVDNGFVDDVRVMNQTDYLAKQGFKIYVFCYKPVNTNYKLHENIQMVYIPSSSFFRKKIKALFNLIPLFEWWWMIQLRKAIKNRSISKLHVHDLYMAKIARKAISDLDIEMILDLHENYPIAIESYKWANKGINKYLARPWMWKKKEGEYLAYTDKLIVLSEFFKNQLLNRFDFLHKDRIAAIPNVPNLERELSASDPLQTEKYKHVFTISYFGVISKRRGIPFVLESLEKLIKQEPEFQIKFLLIGPIDGEEQASIQKQIHRPKIAEKVQYIPWIRLDELGNYLKDVDLCISPLEKNAQHESGVANKIYQYMRFSKSLLVSDCTPQKMLVESSDCGWSHIWNDQQDFVDKLIEIASNPDLLQIKGANGKSFIEEKYNFGAIGKNLVEFYQTTISPIK